MITQAKEIRSFCWLYSFGLIAFIHTYIGGNLGESAVLDTLSTRTLAITILRGKFWLIPVFSAFCWLYSFGLIAFIHTYIGGNLGESAVLDTLSTRTLAITILRGKFWLIPVFSAFLSFFFVTQFWCIHETAFNRRF